MTKINPKLLLDVIYPIGSIYINTTGTNPSTFLGGTWVNYGAGRVLVGQDTNDSDFDTLGETGGSKYLQAHSHSKQMVWGVAGRSYGYQDMFSYSESKTSNQVTINSGGVYGATTGNSGNLQPYIVVSIWQRTA